MELAIVGQVVTGITFEHGISLLVSDGTLITVESPFDIRQSNGETRRIDPQGVEQADAILAALHDEIVGASFDEAGSLEISLTKSKWVMFPDANFESWSLVSPGSPSRVHSGPGVANVAIWN